jgi:catechol 2,3-dioxygenase-like lactoylglutathione lyase family enzyme
LSDTDQPTPGPPPTVNHVGHCVTDLDVALRFWTGLLGFTEVHRMAIPDEAAADLLSVEPPVGLEAVYLQLGGFTLELLHFDRPGNPAARRRVFNEPGLTHLSLSVDDPLAMARRAPEFGGTIEFEFEFASLVRDPDGQVIELLTRDWRELVGMPSPTGGADPE